MTETQRENFGPKLKEVRLAMRMTLKQFYGDIATHVNNFSPIENGLRKIGRRLAEDVIKTHNINPHWLSTGLGSMFLELKDQNNKLNEGPTGYEGVPYFSVNISDTESADFNILRETPEYYVNFKPFNDCDAYLPVYGDSMYPKYASGEIIAVREISNPEIIQWGEAYFVIADDTANNISTVKLLFEHDREDKIVLRASNPNYRGDTIIDRDAIKRLFIVKGKIMRNQL